MRRDFLQRIEKIEASHGMTVRTKSFIYELTSNDFDKKLMYHYCETLYEKLTNAERDWISEWINDALEYVETHLEPIQLELFAETDNLRKIP